MAFNTIPLVVKKAYVQRINDVWAAKERELGRKLSGRELKELLQAEPGEKLSMDKYWKYKAAIDTTVQIPDKSGNTVEVAGEGATEPVSGFSKPEKKRVRTNSNGQKAYVKHMRIQVPVPEELYAAFEQESKESLTPMSLQCTQILADYNRLKKAGVIKVRLAELMPR